MKPDAPHLPESLPPPTIPSRSEIRARLARSGLSNYAVLVVRIAVGLFLTRILFLNLTRVEYGFWALLWSSFGYTLVLDLGFGVAMTKFTSQAAVHGDWTDLNRRLNTVLPLYGAMSVVIALATIVGAPFLGSLLRLEGSPTDLAYYRHVFVIFGLGTAVNFPLGVFAEVLTGVDRIPLRNAFSIAYTLLNFGLLWSVVEAGLGLDTMAFASLGVGISINLVQAAAVRRLLPRFRIDWRLFDRRLLRETLSFSLFSYLITVGTLVLLRIDQLVVGALLAVSLVALYQVAWRLSDMFRQLSVQMLEALGPIAASLFQSGDRDHLQRALSESSRVVAGLATFFYLPLVVYLGPLLEVWLELSDTPARQCGWILLSAGWFAVVFKGATSRVLLMCQQERQLAAATIFEALLNLSLSVALCVYTDLGIVGVALGTLIPAVLVSVGIYVPLAARFSRIPASSWLRETLVGPAAAALLAAPVYQFCREAADPTTLATLLANAVPGAIVFLLAFARFGLRTSERKQLAKLVLRRT